MSEAERLLGLLAEPTRLRVAAALILGTATRAEIARVTGVPDREVERALAKLIAGGLLVREGDRFTFLREQLEEAAKEVATSREDDDSLPGVVPHSEDVLRRFFKGGRLDSIPATRSKRAAVLDYLAQNFTPGVHYTEREVNEKLGRLHDDYASLRRYLVDEGFMERADGEYWRSGGSFPLD